MQTAANANLFFTNVSSFKGLRDRYIIYSAELRPQIVFEIARGLYKQSTLLRVADHFCQIADNAYAFRQMDIVEELAKILIDAPLPRQYESIGQYYQALSICRKAGVIASRPLFERVIDNAPLPYRTKAMVSLGTTFVQTGDLQSARELYNDALRASRNNWAGAEIIVLSHKMSAVVKSIEGNRRGALEELERFLPLAHMVGTASPQILYDYLNGCAVEQLEAGSLEEARNISNIVLASPYVIAYPEWRETSIDIERKGCRSSRSFVPITQGVTQHNIVRLPERESTPSSQDVPGRVLHYDWENKMVKEPNDNPLTSLTRDQILKLSRSEKRVRLVDLVYVDDLSEETLTKILEVAEDMVRKDKTKGSI